MEIIMKTHGMFWQFSVQGLNL